MEQKKKRIPFNIVDVIILVVIVAAAGFFLWRYILNPADAGGSTPTTSYVLVMDNIEIADDAFENGKINVGDTVIEKSSNASLGTITSIDTQPSLSYAVNSDGELIQTSRPLYSRLTITVEGQGRFPSDGGLLIDKTTLFNNKSYEVNIGNSAFYLRVVNIEKLDGEAEGTAG